jgi:hypothetical protein
MTESMKDVTIAGYTAQPVPEARQEVARGGAPRDAPESCTLKPPSPERATEGSPNIPLVIFNGTQFQEFKVFFLKTLSAVMLLLIKDVLSDMFYLRRTNCEAEVARLPFKPLLTNDSVNPSRRVGLDVAKNVVQPMSGT